MQYQVEDLENIKEELTGLFPGHWKEVGAFNFERHPLDPDWAIYDLLAESNFLHIITVREHKKLVGYCIFVLTQHPHYKQTKIAENDLIFIEKPYRKGRAGMGLIKYAIKSLKMKDVQVITLSMKAQHSFQALAEHFGFKLTDLLFTLEV